MRGRKRLIQWLAATTETRRQVQSLKKTPGMVSERGQMQRHGQKPAETVTQLSQHSLAEGPSFLREMSGEVGSVLKNLHPIFSFKLLHDLRLGVPRLSKSSLTRYLSCKDV